MLWVRGRDLSTLTDSAAEMLASAVARLPIRGLDALHAQYGADDEVVAGRLVEEAATLAGWVWATAAVLPAPPPAVHTLKVLVHSAIEIRLIGSSIPFTATRNPPATRLGSIPSFAAGP